MTQEPSVICSLYRLIILRSYLKFQTIIALDREAEYTLKEENQRNILNIYVIATERETPEQLQSKPFLYTIVLASKFFIMSLRLSIFLFYIKLFFCRFDPNYRN